MSPKANKQQDVPVTSTSSAAGPRRARAPVSRAAVVVIALLGTGVLAAACGGASRTTGRSGAHGGSRVRLENRALAYVNCMRTHGEPKMPNPTIRDGRHINVNINIIAGSGVDPTSPQFAAASKACQHLVSQGAAPPANTGAR